MTLQQVLKRSETLVGLAHDIRRILMMPGRKARQFAQKRIIENYLASHATRKLQLGAGFTWLSGWLSTDINPATDQVLFLDATKPFPFVNATFDYVYSEHMIEHLTWSEGGLMLRECRRVLKPGGTVRIATPDLKIILGLYENNRDPLNEKYIKWFTELCAGDLPGCKASFVINAIFRNWGHRFLYDGELLEMALREAGFVNIRPWSPGMSGDEHLKGIETHGKNVAADDMAVFETMVYEGQCPG